MSRRSVGWLLTAASIVVPLLAIVRTRAYVASRYEALGMVIEGKAVASMFMLLVPISVVFALAGVGLGVAAFRALKRPRPPARVVEILIQTLPLLTWLFVAKPLFHWVRDG